MLYWTYISNLHQFIHSLMILNIYLVYKVPLRSMYGPYEFIYT